MITKERLLELETEGRNAYPFKAELKELADVYRSHVTGISVNEIEGTMWVHFDGNKGRKASVSVHKLVEHLGPIVTTAICDWADAQIERKSV